MADTIAKEDGPTCGGKVTRSSSKDGGLGFEVWATNQAQEEEVKAVLAALRCLKQDVEALIKGE